MQGTARRTGKVVNPREQALREEIIRLKQKYNKLRDQLSIARHCGDEVERVREILSSSLYKTEP